jgi:hypothetical protein
VIGSRRRRHRTDDHHVREADLAQARDRLTRGRHVANIDAVVERDMPRGPAFVPPGVVAPGVVAP